MTTCRAIDVKGTADRSSTPPSCSQGCLEKLKAMLARRYFHPVLAILLLLPACGPEGGDQDATNTGAVTIERTGFLKQDRLLEASGMHASRSHNGDFFVHNDEGSPRIYVIDEKGTDLGSVTVVPAKNKDWEDITSIPVDGGKRWLIAGDIGDNMARRKYIKLYFFEEPEPGKKKKRYKGDVDLQHWIDLTYPDGARDCESLAYDPVGDQILLLSKRDKPARLYAIDLKTALSERNAELTFLGEISPLRRPTPADREYFGGRNDFISQPTGLDISADGSEAVIVTYRSIYRFKREPDEDWLSAFQRTPMEVVGPPAPQNEAIAYSTDGQFVYVTTEKIPAPVYRIRFNDAEE